MAWIYPEIETVYFRAKFQEGYDVIQIVKSNYNDNLRFDTKESDCFSWFKMLMGISMGNHKFRGAPGRNP